MTTTPAKLKVVGIMDIDFVAIDLNAVSDEDVQVLCERVFAFYTRVSDKVGVLLLAQGWTQDRHGAWIEPVAETETDPEPADPEPSDPAPTAKKRSRSTKTDTAGVAETVADRILSGVGR